MGSVWKQLVNIRSWWRQAASHTWLWQQFKRVCIAVIAILGLSGCTDYQIGLRIDSPYQGEIIQQIHLSSARSGNSQDPQAWIKSLKNQIRTLQGHVEVVNAQDWIIRIPFTNAADLEQRFNQFFQYLTQPESDADKILPLPPIQSHLSLHQNNFLIFLRSHLIYELDLQSLSLTADPDSSLTLPSRLLHLSFQLQTPNGGRAITPSKRAPLLPAHQSNHNLVWDLKPGEQNRLEAVFWMPNPLGLGTLGILAVVALGFYWQHQQPSDSDKSSTSPS